MADVIHALEVWILVAMLTGWFLGRAAGRLRCSPVAVPELLRAEQAGLEERGAHQARHPDPDSLLRAVRIYERA